MGGDPFALRVGIIAILGGLVLGAILLVALMHYFAAVKAERERIEQRAKEWEERYQATPPRH
ncbi:MAG: hypothetical protein BWY25_02704 [Chloroflexi bacterium ADurb.Bin222]|nr:MAG: hypothetical protein BWY25_02704 [Chloroflexi bacterium ADurb.Bin222]